MIFYNDAKNAQTNVIDRPYTIRSAGKGGSTDNVLGSTDLKVPASPNYPPSESGASTSYYIYLPYAAYLTSTSSTSFALYNETQSKTITVVDQDASLSNYTAKFFNVNSEKRNVIEIHIGTTSNSAGDVISYEGVFEGNAINADTLNNFSVTNIETSSNITCNAITASSFINGLCNSSAFMIDYIDYTGNSTYRMIVEKIIEIGVWSLTSAAAKSIPHFCTDYPAIHDIDVVIRNDSYQRYSLLHYTTGTPNGRTAGIDSLIGNLGTEIALSRVAGSFWASTVFDSTTLYPRGWIYMKYEI